MMLLPTRLKKHVESIHNGVRYTCNQCDYKATQKGHIKKHVESIHDGVCYTCDQCDYKAGGKGTPKRHVESSHKTFLSIQLQKTTEK